MAFHFGYSNDVFIFIVIRSIFTTTKIRAKARINSKVAGVSVYYSHAVLGKWLFFFTVYAKYEPQSSVFVLPL